MKGKKYIEKNDENYKKFYDILKIILRYGVVFARMSPEHKTLLIEKFREEDFSVMMCGDGANDCGALKTADVGVSLSPEEASIAAHFSSNIPDISCVITLLREGKASSVTAIQSFKHMMIFSFIEFFSTTFLLLNGSYFSDNQFLLTGILTLLPMLLLLGYTDAYPELTSDIPETSLISIPIFCSIIPHIIFIFLFLFIPLIVMKAQDWNVSECESIFIIIYPCDDVNVKYYI